ncbi:MAG: tRNA (adenosine(37)-N6)-dimethylallyltransferase MiaA [bacterium]
MTDRIPEIIVLLGPTAVGKTAVSIPLARSLDAEIISADSRQIYVGMDIGTAKPSHSERGAARHHLIDVVDPASDFTVADFMKLSFEKIEEIQKRGKRVLVVGGTGLYIRALIDRPSYQNQPPVPELREELLEEITEKGPEALYEELKRFDPDAAEKIHPNNTPRLIRAIEIIRTTGHRFSDAVKRDSERAKEFPEYEWKLIELVADRDRLYERINMRVVKMIHSGWVDEVRRLLESGCCGDEKPLQGLGYRDIVAHIRGEKSLDAAIELAQRDTRRFAKRQLTFFRGFDDVTRIELSSDFDPNEISARILELFGIV